MQTTTTYSVKTLRTLQNNYYVAKAANETVKSLENELKTRVLTENEFYTEPGESEPATRIINPRSDYRMSDADFERYLDLCHALKPEFGLTHPKENTADCLTSKALKDAENKLLDFGVIILPETPEFDRTAMDKIRNHWKYRGEMIELICKL